MTDRSRWFVQPSWLIAHLDDPDVVVVDGSWHLAGRDARAEYDAAHIPGRGVLRHRRRRRHRQSPAPHAADAGGLRRGGRRSSASTAGRRSSSTTPSAFPRRRASGGPSASWAPPTSSSSTAACRRGSPRDCRPTPTGSARPPRKFRRRRSIRRVVVDLGGVRGGLAGGAFPGGRRAPGRALPRRGAGAARLGQDRAAYRAASTSPRPTSSPDGRLKDDDALRQRFAERRGRSRPADRDELRLGRERGDLSLALDILGVAPRPRSTTARGPNGARATTCRSPPGDT